MPYTAFSQLDSSGASTPLAGALGTFSLVDLIQMVENAGKTGELSVFFNGLSAHLHFNHGMLVDAEVGGMGGQDAFRRILQLKEGHFEFESQEPWHNLTIHVNLTQLLLEAFRQADELLRDEGSIQDLQRFAS